MSFLGGLFKNEPVKTETTSTLPAWASAAGQDVWGQATQAADKPFVAFGSNPYGGTSADSRAAIEGIRDNVNYMTTGGGKDMFADLLGRGPQKVSTEGTFDSGDIAKYMNPYTEAALQPALRKIQEASDAARKRIGAGATAARAFGDARHGITESQLDKNTSQAAGDTASQFMMQAFRDAVATKTGDINRELGADTTNAGLAQQDLANKSNLIGQQNSILTSNLAQLLSGGQYEDSRETQKGLFDLQEFLREQGFDQSQLGWLGQMLAGLPMDKSQTSTQSGGVGPGYGLVGGALAGLASKI